MSPRNRWALLFTRKPSESLVLQDLHEETITLASSDAQIRLFRENDIVLFQADIRRALAHLGRAPFFRYFLTTEGAEETIEELAVAATQLSAQRIGVNALRNWSPRYATLDVTVLEKPFDLEQLTASVAAALASAPRRPEHWPQP